jgi:hypothetical protein
VERVSPAGRCYSQWSAQCSTYWWYSACQQQSMTAEFKAQIFRCSDFKTHFYIILRSTPVALPFMLYGSYLIHNSHSHHVYYIPCTSHNFLNHHTNVWCTLQINCTFVVFLLFGDSLVSDSDAGDSPKRKYTTFRITLKFEIKNNVLFPILNISSSQVQILPLATYPSTPCII